MGLQQCCGAGTAVLGKHAAFMQHTQHVRGLRCVAAEMCFARCCFVLLTDPEAWAWRQGWPASQPRQVHQQDVFERRLSHSSFEKPQVVRRGPLGLSGMLGCGCRVHCLCLSGLSSMKSMCLKGVADIASQVN